MTTDQPAPALEPQTTLPSAAHLIEARELGRYLYAESVMTNTQTTRWDKLPARARAYWTAVAADKLMKRDAT